MSPKTILLVEDNPDDEELTLLAMRRSKILYEVVVVRDGVEALDYLLCRGQYESRDPSATPQLVLLDLKLPKLDGIEVLRELRANPRTATLQIVVLTSSSQEEDVVASYRSGANSYVRKPVSFDQFVDAIGQIGRYWLSLNEPPPINP